METVTLSEARVYVGTYNKYNSGSLFGKWLDLSDYSDKDEFMEACRELHPVPGSGNDDLPGLHGLAQHFQGAAVPLGQLVEEIAHIVPIRRIVARGASPVAEIIT